MREYIHKLQNKPEDHRKLLLIVFMAISMSIVAGVWVYSLNQRFSTPTVAEKSRDDIKPFILLGDSIKNTYQNITASAGTTVIEKDVTAEKQIDLIPVEQPAN
jgi:hypothetical protein